ncbi:CotD family spore coat protein [Peribacillus muralis]|uniref:CotD family spore coat protein n=2 Tax=Peribacillus muralis TaxID=264697 RepID=UPI00386D5835
MGGLEMKNNSWQQPNWGQCPPQHCPPQYCPPNVSPTQYDPPQVSPTKQYVNTNVSNTVIPVIHPSHTKTVNKHVNTYKHYFPHTQSVVNECCTQNLICGVPHNPCPPNPCPPNHWHAPMPYRF